MWPTKTQWKRWSLPSKLTAIGTLIGFVSLVFSIFAFLFPRTFTITGETTSKTFRLLDSHIICSTNDICRDRITFLPLMALARPSAIVYSRPFPLPINISPILLRSYWPIFVFDKKTSSFGALHEGWYQIGVDTKQPVGWLQAADTIEWKQRLIVDYNHQAEYPKMPLLLFRSLSDIKAIYASRDVNVDINERLSAIFEQIKAGKPPTYIVGIVPIDTQSIENHFYITPILSFEHVMLDSGAEGRFLEISPDTTHATLFSKLPPGSGVTAWIFDRTLDGNAQVTIRVVLRRRELEAMLEVLRAVLQDAKDGKLGSLDFFRSLRSVVLKTTKLSVIGAETLGGGMDEKSATLWHNTLPYTSDIQSMDEDLWNAMSVDQQAEYINSLDKRLRAYERILSNPDKWIPLNDNDPFEEYVYPLPLQFLS